MMSAIELLPCPFCGMKPWHVQPSVRVVCKCGAAGEWGSDYADAADKWNRRTDLSQATVAAALEAAANEMWPMLRSMISRGDAAKAIRALITIDQHDALSAHVAAEVAKARAEDAAKIEALAAELQWYGEQARLCRLIHSEGDAGRHALNNDGGKRAAAALSQIGAKP